MHGWVAVVGMHCRQAVVKQVEENRPGQGDQGDEMKDKNAHCNYG